MKILTVGEVQRMLIRLGFELKPTKIHDKQTREAIQAFQGCVGLHRSGDITDLTCLKLEDRVKAVGLGTTATSGQNLIDRTCYVQLGSFGDIINVLPLAYEEWQKTSKIPVMMVEQNYASVLEGVSYVEPFIWEGPRTALGDAVRVASKTYSKVIATQVNGIVDGKSWECRRANESFVLDSWALAGADKLNKFNKLPLIFDKRDLEREQELVKKLQVCPGDVIACFNGVSSPFFQGAVVASKLGYEQKIVDISHVKAHRIYDMLGVFELASCLVLVDSALLHLAAACSTPVIAYITDTPSLWHGTKPRCNTACAIRYKDACTTNVDKLALASLVRPRKMIHVFSYYFPDDKDTRRRNEFAQLSWARATNINRQTNPVSVSEGRTFHDDLLRHIPFVKDIIKIAYDKLDNDEDIIVLTNTDTCVTKDVELRLRAALASSECCYAGRHDFPCLTSSLDYSYEVVRGKSYAGVDLFAFKKGWWKKAEPEFPDMLFGAEAWDGCLRTLMIRYGGKQIENVVYHEEHQALWTKGSNMRSLSSQQHNLSEARKLNFHKEFTMSIPISSTKKIDPSVIVDYHRQSVPVKKPKLTEVLHDWTWSNSQQGLGDNIILTGLMHVPDVQIWSPSQQFKNLRPYIRGLRDNKGLKHLMVDHLYQDYDLGGGHFIQCLQRATGNDVMTKPMGSIISNSSAKKPIVLFHFEPGPHVEHQRIHNHPRAREIYPETLSILAQFVKDHPELEFFEISTEKILMPTVRSFHKRPLSELVELMDKASYLIGVISGPTHLATAMGIKVINIINFPHASKIVLPSIRHTGMVEEEWFYPQNALLHQDNESELVPKITLKNLERAFNGEIYPYWSDEYLNLIHE